VGTPVRATEFRAEGFEAVEIVGGSAVLALGLGGIAEVETEDVGVDGEALEAFDEQEVAILRAADFDSGDEFVGHGQPRLLIEGDHVVEAGGEEAGFQAGGAQEGELGEGDALDGEHLLGVDGLVDIDGVVLEIGDLLEIFEADNGVIGGGEAVLAGVLSGTGLAFGRARAGRFSGVSAIGCELLG